MHQACIVILYHKERVRNRAASSSAADATSGVDETDL